MSLLLTIFDKPVPRDIRVQHGRRAVLLQHTYDYWMGGIRRTDDADYEDFYEQAARLDAALNAFGDDVWLHVPGRDRVVHLASKRTKSLEELQRLPRYGVQPGTIHTPVTLCDEELASDYFGYEALTSRLGRRTAVVDWLPDGGGRDFIDAVRTMLDEGVTDFFVKATKTKLGIFRFALAADASDRDIWDALTAEAGYALEHTGSGKRALFVQEAVPMRFEYRLFVLGQEVVTGGASIEEFTPLDNESRFDPKVREHREERSEVIEDAALVTRLVEFGRTVAADLAAEQPDLVNYVVDVAIGADGEPLVIELNGLLNSGLFASDPRRVARAHEVWLTRTQAALLPHVVPMAVPADGVDRCACGEEISQDTFVGHAAAAAGVGVRTAGDLLRLLHDFEAYNVGACGGCDTCGDAMPVAVCGICGESDMPCATYLYAEERATPREPVIATPLYFGPSIDELV